MKNVQFPILFATFYLVLYVACLEILGMTSVVLILFGLSPVVIVWMVIRVLKDGVPSGKTFTDHFYDDHAYIRVPIIEEGNEIQLQLEQEEADHLE